MQDTRDALEQRQIPIYFAAVALAAVAAWALPGTGVLERAINPALALMLYVTFLQVPLPSCGAPSARCASWRR